MRVLKLNLRRKIVLAAVAVVGALSAVGVASAFQVAQGSAEGNGLQVVHLEAVDTTTAFTVGTWTFGAKAPLTVEYNVNCFNPINNSAGTIVLPAGSHRYDVTIWDGLQSVHNPWGGWDRCFAQVEVTAYMNAVDSGYSDAVTAWIDSHNGL